MNKEKSGSKGRIFFVLSLPGEAGLRKHPVSPENNIQFILRMGKYDYLTCFQDNKNGESSEREGSYAGRNTENVAPLPGLPSALMKPLWFSAIFLHIESPIPDPG